MMRPFSVNRHLLMTITIIVVVLSAWWIGPHHELMKIWIQQAGWWGPLVTVLFYILLSFTPIPADPLTIVSVLLFGPWMGFFVSWMGNNAAAFMEYVVAKHIEKSLRIDYETLPLWLRRFPVSSIWFLIGVRFVPAIGGKMVAIMAGMYHVGWRRFIWTTMIANLFGSFLWAVGGIGLIWLY